MLFDAVQHDDYGMHIMQHVLERPDKYPLSVNLQNERGDTLLHCVISYYSHNPHLELEGEYIKLLNTLIEKGASVNIVNRDGMTPLHLAVESGREDITEVLIQRKLIQGFSTQKPDYLTGASSTYWDRCLDEVKKLEEENKLLYDFLKESNTEELFEKWEKNENVRSKFDDQESLKKQYPEYAHILINKANEVEKEIFLHNHKPLIDALSTHYGRDFQAMTFAGIKNFFEVHNDIMIKIVKYERNGNSPEVSGKLETDKPLAIFVNFKDTEARHIPKLKLCLAALQVIGNAPSRNLLNPNSEQYQAVGLLYS